MKYSGSGFLVTVVGQNDLPYGLFAPDGSTRVTQDQGLGLYAPNGSIRIGSSGNSVYTPRGAWNGTLVGRVFTPINTGGGSIPLRTVITHNRINQAERTAPAGTSYYAFRWPIPMGCDASDLIISNNSWYNNAVGEVAASNAFTILDMAIENSAGSKTVPVLFAGQRSITIQPDSIDLQSDALLPSGFTLPKFSRGEIYWLRGKISVPVAGVSKIPSSSKRASWYGGTQGLWYDPAATTMSSTDTGGAFTSTGAAPNGDAQGYCPIVLGHPLVDGPSFFCFGDSIPDLTGDTVNNINGVGFFQRAMHDADGTSNPLPSINFARSTCQYIQFAGSNTRWQKFIKYAKYAVDEMGTNDFANSASSLTVQGRATALWAVLRTAGIQKIIRTQIVPRTSGAWTLSDGSDQTFTGAQTAFAPGGDVDNFKAWLSTKLADGSVDKLVLMDGTRLSGVPQKWLANGTAAYGTTDGIHPTAVLHEAMAVDLRAAIASL